MAMAGAGKTARPAKTFLPIVNLELLRTAGQIQARYKSQSHLLHFWIRSMGRSSALRGGHRVHPSSWSARRSPHTMSATVTPHVKAVRYESYNHVYNLALTKAIGPSTDDHSDSPSTGLYSGIYGEAKQSIFVLFSTPTETSTTRGDREYA